MLWCYLSRWRSPSPESAEQVCRPQNIWASRYDCTRNPNPKKSQLPIRTIIEFQRINARFPGPSRRKFDHVQLWADFSRGPIWIREVLQILLNANVRDEPQAIHEPFQVSKKKVLSHFRDNQIAHGRTQVRSCC